MGQNYLYSLYKAARETKDEGLTVSDDFKPGLEGVIAFESEIAEPDKEGSALRYRGVDIEDLVGRVSFGNVWGLLVDDKFNPGLPPAEPFLLPVHTGDVRVDVQSAIAMLAPAWGLKPLLDISDDEARNNLARASVMVLSYVAQSARGGAKLMIPQSEIDKAHTVVERSTWHPVSPTTPPSARTAASKSSLEGVPLASGEEEVAIRARVDQAARRRVAPR